MPAGFGGTYSTSVMLNNPRARNPATVTGTGKMNIGVAAAPGIRAILTAGLPWTSTNRHVHHGSSDIRNRISGGPVTDAVLAILFASADRKHSGAPTNIVGAPDTTSIAIELIGTSGAMGVYLSADGTISNTETISLGD